MSINNALLKRAKQLLTPLGDPNEFESFGAGGAGEVSLGRDHVMIVVGTDKRANGASRRAPDGSLVYELQPTGIWVGVERAGRTDDELRAALGDEVEWSTQWEGTLR